MISAAQFKQNVEHRGLFGQVKSPGRIMFIHAALEAYEESKRLGQSPIQQLSYLNEVAKQCRHWLKAKAGKSSATSGQRKRQVNSLMGEMAAEMAQRFPEQWKALSAFSGRKAAFTGNSVAQGPQGVYAHEKALYDRKKAAGAYVPGADRMTASASILRHEMPAFENPGNVHNATFKTSSIRGFVYSGGRFDDLNEAQFREVDRIVGGQINMLYLSKIQRLEHMVLIDGGLMKWPKGSPITLMPGRTVLDEMNNYMYAIDKYGNFFTMYNPLKNPVQLNHTTLCAGEAVVCAGTVSIKNGRLRGISNDSGHYAPDAARLKAAIQLLIDSGVSMDNVVAVECSKAHLTNRKDEFLAKTFMGAHTGIGVGGSVNRLLAATN